MNKLFKKLDPILINYIGRGLKFLIKLGRYKFNKLDILRWSLLIKADELTDFEKKRWSDFLKVPTIQPAPTFFKKYS